MAGKKLISQINAPRLSTSCWCFLVMSMITAPMLESGIDVNLPKTAGGQLKADEEPVILTINRDGRIFLSNTAVNEVELAGKLEAIFKRRSQKVVFSTEGGRSRALRARGQGNVLSCKGGIRRIAMVTEDLSPQTERKPRSERYLKKESSPVSRGCCLPFSAHPLGSGDSQF